jgi:hypothetical protein
MDKGATGQTLVGTSPIAPAPRERRVVRVLTGQPEQLDGPPDQGQRCSASKLAVHYNQTAMELAEIAFVG